MAGGQGEISSPNFLSWWFFYKKKAPLPHLQPQQEILVVVPSHCPPCCWVGVTIPGVSPGVWGCWGSSAGCWAGGLRVQEGAQCVWSWERQEGTCLEPPLPGHCVPSEVCPCLVGTGMVQRERLCSAGFWFLVFGFGVVSSCPSWALCGQAAPGKWGWQTAWISSLPKPHRAGLVTPNSSAAGSPLPCADQNFLLPFLGASSGVISQNLDVPGGGFPAPAASHGCAASFQISDIYISGELGDMSAKEKLLLWTQKVTAGYIGLKCTNFSSCWSDGKMFNALIHRYR